LKGKELIIQGRELGNCIFLFKGILEGDGGSVVEDLARSHSDIVEVADDLLALYLLHEVLLFLLKENAFLFLPIRLLSNSNLRAAPQL
jgi:hypothetical protein